MQRLFLFLLGLPLVAIVSADEGTPALYDRVSLSVSAEKPVANDRIVAELYTEREGDEISQITSEVNQNITWALDLARGVDNVIAQTTGYVSQPVYKEQTIIGWRVRQSIKLESQDAAGLSQLIGDLQKRLAIGSLIYNLSPDVRTQAEDDLIAQALASFQKRAQLITGKLGRSSFRFVQIDVVTAGPSPRPQRLTRMAAPMEAAEGTVPPAIEGGVQIVRVRVNGTIELKLN
ncbi:MAG: SIMPL domain-containing protein [Arenicellales bacterium]|nr:SIMPL domain-containing protein [Arenicellales bacterium]